MGQACVNTDNYDMETEVKQGENIYDGKNEHGELYGENSYRKDSELMLVDDNRHQGTHIPSQSTPININMKKSSKPAYYGAPVADDYQKQFSKPSISSNSTPKPTYVFRNGALVEAPSRQLNLISSANYSISTQHGGNINTTPLQSATHGTPGQGNPHLS